MTADNKKKKNSLTIDGKRLSTDRIAKAAFLQHMNDMDFNFDEFLAEIRNKIIDMNTAKALSLHEEYLEK